MRRERRAHPTLTPALREAVVEAVTARCRDGIADLVQAAAVDIDVLLRERVMDELVELLPGIVETALAETLAASAGDDTGDDG